MGLKLSTGDTGQKVLAADDGLLYRSIFGDGCYVLEAGKQFDIEIQSNNKIKVCDGNASIQGRHVILPSGDSDVVTINNGGQGVNRKDLIVIRYEKSSTGVESAGFKVIQGAETAGSAVAPKYVDGNILQGAVTKEFPLYEVELKGINIVGVTPIFEVLTSMIVSKKDIAQLNNKLDGSGCVLLGDNINTTWKNIVFDKSKYDSVILLCCTTTGTALASVTVPMDLINTYPTNGEISVQSMYAAEPSNYCAHLANINGGVAIKSISKFDKAMLYGTPKLKK